MPTFRDNSTLGSASVSLSDGNSIVFTCDFTVGSGVISGTGRLTSSSSLLLSGTHAYTGITTITSGSFTVNGSIASSSLTTGEAENFDPMQNYTWIIATADDSLTGFDPGNFTIDTSAFFNASDTARFSPSSDGHNLSLTYSAIPEPATWALFATSVLLGLLLTPPPHS